MKLDQISSPSLKQMEISARNGSSPQHVLDKQYSFLHKDLKKSLIC
ncbi:hypothetical protein GTCCBUS3UF5_2140 [Geobacillus thermoleovorans CCB_US3_UF5]|uniref:Transposase n=1 Tax=Geobacillus thermoleovorans CCB_US3_UF5 TaxID=1111068 RepID=A0ABM5MD13_GEOTH|nr:hypothetical protein GTCCBUS3UF5_2140 [Geobacillus thermoleovorans CCB_US3_UF5]